jgi:hypothetical protein
MFFIPNKLLTKAIIIIIIIIIIIAAAAMYVGPSGHTVEGAVWFGSLHQ